MMLMRKMMAALFNRIANVAENAKRYLSEKDNAGRGRSKVTPAAEKGGKLSGDQFPARV
jgi:hypothetical protein